MSHKRTSKIVTPKDEWQTPRWLFELLNREFHFDFDGACTRENCLCDHGAFVGEFDPLSWTPTWKRIFLNPPYSAALINAFMKKAYEESLKGALVVCLVPVSGDRWWIDYALKAQEIRYIHGRVKFVGYDIDGNRVNGSPMFSSCVVIFNRDLSRGYPIIGTTIEQPKKVRKDVVLQTEKE